MRDQLIHYVDLLFAGAAGAADVKQEILQNTLDRYDDLIAQGKPPQAAYSLAISGIGDLSEILTAPASEPPMPVLAATPEKKPKWKKYVRAIAVFLYIICAIPLIVLSELGMDILGLCATISIAAVATVAIMVASEDGKEKDEDEDKDEDKDEDEKEENLTPRQSLRKAVRKTVSSVGLVVYFVVSFSTGAWHITWLIFPMISAVQGVVTACMDLKEAKENEK